MTISPVPRRLTFVALVALLGVGCADTLGVDEDSRVDFALEPSQVQSGDSLKARLVIRNSSSDTLTLGSPSSCVATLEARLGGERVPLEGTLFGCLTVFTTFRIAPGDSLVRVFDLKAALHGADGAPPGRYVVTAVMQVELADVERVLIVDGVAAQQVDFGAHYRIEASPDAPVLADDVLKVTVAYGACGTERDFELRHRMTRSDYAELWLRKVTPDEPCAMLVTERRALTVSDTVAHAVFVTLLAPGDRRFPL